MSDLCARGAVAGLPAPLLRLHRHSRANVLVLGGTRTRRLAIARALHLRGPLAREAFLAVDCARDEARLARALENWLLAASNVEGGEPDPAGQAGTLFLDSVAELSSATQRLLLMLAHRLQGQPADTAVNGPARLMAGERAGLVRAAERGRFSGALLDHLDKIRVDLGHRRSRGVA